jgi:hypothetical protein
MGWAVITAGEPQPILRGSTAVGLNVFAVFAVFAVLPVFPVLEGVVPASEGTVGGVALPWDLTALLRGTATAEVPGPIADNARSVSAVPAAKAVRLVWDR